MHRFDWSLVTGRGLAVPEVGLEPTSLSAHDFESCMFANFITLAYGKKYHIFALSARVQG